HRVLDVVELAREPAQAVLQSRGERSIRRRPGRKAERGDGAHARHLGRGGGVRLRGRGPALRARVPRARSAAADVRRRPRGGEAPDDRIHERRAGEDVGIPPQGAGDIRAGRRERNVEAMNQMRNVKCGMRSEEHTSELQSLAYLVCRLLLEKKKKKKQNPNKRNKR